MAHDETVTDRRASHRAAWQIRFHPVFDALVSGAVLVVASTRQARALSRLYGEYRESRGDQAWETPRIVSWQAWLAESLQEVDLHEAAWAARMLGPAEETWLWELAIRQDRDADTLLSVSGAAALAADAWTALHAYGVPLTALNDSPSRETQMFLGWAERFTQALARYHRRDSARASEYAFADLKACGLYPGQKIFVYGFVSETPSQTRLWERLAVAGLLVMRMPLPRAESVATRIACTEPTMEIRVAADWAAERLAQGCATVAVVVTDIASRRDELERLFWQRFAPGFGTRSGKTRAPFNIGLGSGLDGRPVIAAALALLDAIGESLDYRDAGVLLRSPFVGDALREASARSSVDRWCRSHGREIPWAVLTEALEDEGSPRLARRLREAERALGVGSRVRSSEWVARFSRTLEALGWPGEQGLTSDEFQAVEVWQEVLRALGGFDDMGGQLTCAAARRLLRRFAALRPFQPGAADVPIQILSPAEAVGLHFDALWMLGADDSRWPPAPDPNPLWPFAVGREYGLPRASADERAAFAREISTLLWSSAPEVWVSYAERDGDRRLRPSPLIDTAIVASPDAMVSALPATQLFKGAPALASAPDVVGTPFPEGTRVERGAALLKDQAACPFRGYARSRFGVQALAEPAASPSGAERGQITHMALASLRTRWPDATGLSAFSRADQNEAITTDVRRAVARIGGRWGERLRALELTRQARLISRWIELEGRRLPFTVTATEREYEAEFAGLVLRVRLDRIDEVGGQWVVLDYKTGKAAVGAWESERPDEPQMPLYAAIVRPGALLYACLAWPAPHVRGLGDSDTWREAQPQLKITTYPPGEWQERLAGWRAVIEALAAGVRAGDARVMPKSATTCARCDLAHLCRIDEWRDQPDAGDEEGGGEDADDGVTELGS